MAYFNHAFVKSFVVAEVDATANTATSALPAGTLGLVDSSDWQTIATANGTLGNNGLLYLVQGNYQTADSIGNNPGHGGYSESVKSKGINPKYINALWKGACVNPVVATAQVSIGKDCAPCGETQYVRVDIKGSPALRFLNKNVYAIGDSGSVCCASGQTHVDPAVALATIGRMLLADPVVKPFIQEATGGGIVINTNGSNATKTISQVLDAGVSGAYTASTDPVSDNVSATLKVEAAYVESTFGNASFDTRDFYGKEPLSVELSFVDMKGDPCDSCGTASKTPGKMQQTSGETVLRKVLLSESYAQNPFSQGAIDSARIREIEGSDKILAAVDRSALYRSYYIQHSVPRFNNPTGTFDNDQYLYEIFVKCSDSDLIGKMDALLTRVEALANDVKNMVKIETPDA
tara:strand:- start:361 stop:1575 length:1215 start_codon:yes stop_codon:yes gene_type:complete